MGGSKSEVYKAVPLVIRISETISLNLSEEPPEFAPIRKAFPEEKELVFVVL